MPNPVTITIDPDGEPVCETRNVTISRQNLGQTIEIKLGNRIDACECEPLPPCEKPPCFECDQFPETLDGSIVVEPYDDQVGSSGVPAAGEALNGLYLHTEVYQGLMTVSGANTRSVDFGNGLALTATCVDGTAGSYVRAQSGNAYMDTSTALRNEDKFEVGRTRDVFLAGSKNNWSNRNIAGGLVVAAGSRRQTVDIVRGANGLPTLYPDGECSSQGSNIEAPPVMRMTIAGGGNIYSQETIATPTVYRTYWSAEPYVLEGFQLFSVFRPAFTGVGNPQYPYRVYARIHCKITFEGTFENDRIASGACSISQWFGVGVATPNLEQFWHYSTQGAPNDQTPGSGYFTFPTKGAHNIPYTHFFNVLEYRLRSDGTLFGVERYDITEIPFTCTFEFVS